MDNNVIKFPQNHALFNKNVRSQLAAGVAEYTDKPDETVDRVEQVLCTAIVSFVRAVGTQLGRKLGEKAGGKVASISR